MELTLIGDVPSFGRRVAPLVSGTFAWRTARILEEGLQATGTHAKSQAVFLPRHAEHELM